MASEKFEKAVEVYLSHKLGRPVSIEEVRSTSLEDFRYEIEKRNGQPLQYTSGLTKLVSHEEVEREFEETLKGK